MIHNSPILGVEEVLALEKRLEAAGTPLHELMNRAGRSVAEWIYESRCAEARVGAVEGDGVKSTETTGLPMHVVILCGTGNNGGDGWVVADYLAIWGFTVSLVSKVTADDLQAEPARATAQETLSKGHATLSLYTAPDREVLVSLIESAVVVVDAIFGIGFEGLEVREPYAQWIRIVNEMRGTRSQLSVVAVDVPSGLSAQSGKAACPTIKADTTITMLAYKPGLLEADSSKHCGTILLAELVGDKGTG
ncbi:MAG: NAD(P)H-hydrate epimerase [Coriobacteriia bacterium]|nr:NAD(P)H-hydrate epimerase [Coriobacteriia bacterium]